MTESVETETKKAYFINKGTAHEAAVEFLNTFARLNPNIDNVELTMDNGSKIKITLKRPRAKKEVSG
jgi:hypothetical protein